MEVPKTRSVPFYPTALERGSRSERALKAAIAEMYVHGVTTRKVAAVMEELCGLDVSSSQVSRATQALDEELSAWRNRPLGEIAYLFLDARYEKVRVGRHVRQQQLLRARAAENDVVVLVTGPSQTGVARGAELERQFRDLIDEVFRRRHDRRNVYNRIAIRLGHGKVPPTAKVRQAFSLTQIVVMSGWKA